MTKNNNHNGKIITIFSLIGILIVAILSIGAFAIINSNKQLPPKETFATCEKRLPQNIKNDIQSGEDFDGFYAKIQDANKYADWSGCVAKKLGIDQEYWNNMVAEQTGPENPTPEEIENSSDTLPSNFVRDYTYSKQFFKVFDFDGFSVLVNQRPDNYAMELAVYGNDSSKLSVAADACSKMYASSKQSDFKITNDYTLDITQPFFNMGLGNNSIADAFNIFDSFSCVHTILGVPEWSSEDAWMRFIGSNNSGTKWSKRWGNYRLNLSLQYDGNGDYKFVETIIEV